MQNTNTLAGPLFSKSIHSHTTVLLYTYVAIYIPVAPHQDHFLFSQTKHPYFSSQLSACLSHAGYDPSLYKCHSFRICAATTAATRGYTDVQIQSMGRWRSAAFRRYIRIPMMTL
ncbi:hypothetical protein NP493_8g09036 [Ridgeia piscesae]|uniref:Tyr recombinase domain-containing protein n=1 Tax=Ridgeia piscesae TaxID=27915 RepID=A0AAD9KSI3_RIDPI|nr:hypothetical protein NP493_696g02013 [Ridgeia piscesae]KAK2179172.1 hypothetical protein NP493_505g01050 [Ridgeia piscesae]KAK2184138.1 hypothetical protein NP493_282g03023 [Ridgeia piscesae]KAK2187917.1 hypothetical protein NP493_150g02044 [Ridgeia piscesae]KAK2188477.1 hypothetical protein NP493_131g03005 [Ridgeia piscesae]